MILQPLGSRVLIKRRIIGKLGSLYIPKDSQQMRACIGEVVEIGPECETVKAGDIVTFGRYAPLVIDIGDLQNYGFGKIKGSDSDNEYLLMNECDLLSIVVREDTEKQ